MRISDWSSDVCSSDLSGHYRLMAKETSESVALGILRDAGATGIEVTKRNHVKIKWTYKGQKRMTVMASTASDARAIKNEGDFVNRHIREIDNACLSTRYSASHPDRKRTRMNSSH